MNQLKYLKIERLGRILEIVKKARQCFDKVIIGIAKNTEKKQRIDKQKMKEAIEKSIKAKDANLVGNMASQGTTPRQLTDLIDSLCDLTSGSGDKGTPIILIQGYFDNLADA